VSISVAPAGASLSVDGRPLERSTRADDASVFVAGIRAPRPGAPVPSGGFPVALDPGAHVFTFSRKGVSHRIVNRTFSAGSTSNLKIELDKLPATLHIASDRDGAIVTVNGSDVGPVPVDVLRPAGSYRVRVKKDGFLPYDAQVAVKPGEELTLRTKLA